MAYRPNIKTEDGTIDFPLDAESLGGKTKDAFNGLLGAYDYIDGNNIVRQTGYYTFTGAETIQKVEDSKYPLGYVYFVQTSINNILLKNTVEIPTASLSGYISVPSNYENMLDNTITFSFGTVGRIVISSSKSQENLLLSLKGAILTYQTASVLGQEPSYDYLQQLVCKDSQKFLVDEFNKSANLIQLVDKESTTINGITCSISNGVITLNGTATTNFFGELITLKKPITSGTYYYKPFNKPDDNTGFYLNCKNSSGTTIINANTSATTTSDITYLQFYIIKGFTCNNLKISPMLVEGTIPPTEFQLYNASKHITNEEADFLKSEKARVDSDGAIIHKSELENKQYSYTPAGTVSSTFSGTKVTPTATFTGATSSGSVSYTPAGTITNTFSGTKITPTATFTGTASSGSATYTPAGTVSKPTITITQDTTTAKTIKGIASVGTNPSWSASYNASTETLAFGWDAGSQPTTAATTVYTGFKAALDSTPTFTGTQTTITTSITPKGTISVGDITPAGTVSSAFKGTAATISISITPKGSISCTDITPAGTVSSTFTGTAATIK